MTADSFIEVVKDSVDLTGMTNVPSERRIRLLSDDGQVISLIPSENTCGWRASATFWLRPSILRPTTNWRGITGALNLTSTRSHTTSQGNLEVTITGFENYYNNWRYHKALGNVSLADVLDIRRGQILEKRKEVQTQIFQRRRLHNQHFREVAQSAPNLH